MTPQNIVPVTGLNEVSGSGLLIGWLPFIVAHKSGTKFKSIDVTN
jgi:hypothetical protein